MELNEEFDKKYKKDKVAYEKVATLEEKLENIKSEIKIVERQKEDAQINQIRAVEDKNKAEQENAEKEIKKAKEKIDKLTEQVNKIKGAVSKNKEKVDSYIEELKKDPEFEKQINLILEKRYNRKFKQALKEQEQVKMIIDLCQNHPSLENNLKGMIRAKEERDKLDKELSQLEIPKDQQRIDEIKNIEIPALLDKKEKNETAFMEFCSKKDIVIDKKFLQELIKNKSFAHDKTTGDIQVTKTLRSISKGYDRKIDVYRQSVQKIPNAIVHTGTEQNVPKQETRGNVQAEQSSSLPPIQKHKWWEFRKRFKDWNERRKVAKEQNDFEDEQDEKTVRKDKDKDKDEESNKFKDAYKYDVVKDYIKMKEKEIEKEVKTNKENKNKEENER